MDMLPLLCLLSVAFTGLCEGVGVLPDGPLTARVGDTVRFTTTVEPPRDPFLAIIWEADGRTVVRSTTSSNTTGAPYQGRITLFTRTGSLEVRNVTLKDSGTYTLQMLNGSAHSQDGETSLQVLVPVSSVTVAASSTSLLEFNSSVTLSCSSGGNFLSFAWLNGSSPITDTEGVQITDGGRNLTIVAVTRYDRGPFRCNVSNAISHNTSEPVRFSIDFGPDDPSLIQSPPHQYVERGSNVSLSCSAPSRPPATFQWYLNGDLLQAGSNLSLIDVHRNHSGNYSCQAFNSRTLRYTMSQPAAVMVLEKISSVYISSSSSHLLLEGNSINLTCEAAGSIFARTWTKDGSALTLSDNVTLHDDGRVLWLRSLQKSDGGEYSCRVSNPINHAQARHSLVVNYGPEDVAITGPSEVTVEDAVTLTCSAASTPAANYTWIHIGREIHSSPTLTINSAQPSDGGNYTCHASNSVTGRTSVASHYLSVTAPTDPGLSPGAIAGIIIGVFALIGAGVAASCVYTKRRKSECSLDTGSLSGKEETGDDNPAYSDNKELHYEDVRIISRNNHGDSPCELQKSSTVYSEIRLNNQTAPTSPPTYDNHIQRQGGRSVHAGITDV